MLLDFIGLFKKFKKSELNFVIDILFQVLSILTSHNMIINDNRFVAVRLN